MNAKPLISFIAAALFSLSAHAFDCSGGANGGTDATGNECNDATHRRDDRFVRRREAHRGSPGKSPCERCGILQTERGQAYCLNAKNVRKPRGKAWVRWGRKRRSRRLRFAMRPNDTC